MKAPFILPLLPFIYNLGLGLGATDYSQYASNCEFNLKLQTYSIDGYCVNVGPKCTKHNDCFAPKRSQAIVKACKGKGKPLRAGGSCLDGICRHSLFVEEGSPCSCFARCGLFEGGYEKALYCVDDVCQQLPAVPDPEDH